MPYRQDLDALRERLAHLDAELARLRQMGAHLEALRAQEAAMAREAEDVRRRIDQGSAKRRLPTLDAISVASPCSEKWDEMLGDDRVRFCLLCEKNVYNLSAMSRADAEALLTARAGSEMCVRYFKRTDGTIMTSDCPVGAKKKRRKKLALAIAGAGAMAAAAATAFGRQQCTTQGGVVMGEMGAYVPPTPPTPEATVTPTAAPPLPPPPQEVVGRMAPPRGEAIMGKRSVR